MPMALAATALVATGVSAYGQYRAGKSAAAVDEATAQYNANVDKVQAQQIDLDTQQNIRTERQANAQYLSRQAASYANAGVLATSGSALHAQVTNAGRMEQQIQQQYLNSQQRQQQLYSSAAIGVAEGAAEASADRMRANLALIDGGAKMASMLASDIQSGAFGGGGGKLPEGDD